MMNSLTSKNAYHKTSHIIQFNDSFTTDRIMKKAIIFLIITMISIASYAQSDSSFLIDDIRFSLNLSSSESGDIGNQLGFGIGVYHTFSPEKKFNTILGVEFNRNNQVISYMHEEDNSYATDVKFHTSALSLLAVSRYSIGRRTKVFVEAGVFLEYVRSLGRSGTMHSPKDSLGVEFRDGSRRKYYTFGF